MLVRIIKANVSHLAKAAELFNAYRRFYKQPDDMAKAQQYLADRINTNQSVIMLAFNDEGSQNAIGFMQLYQGFSSISAQRHLILNDLFVAETARRQGVGEKLILEAQKYAANAGYERITLETAPDNVEAKRLYSKLGFQMAASSHFDSFSLAIAQTSQPEQRFERKKRPLVVITGVTSGLGAAMIKEFTKRNWMIAGCGRSSIEIAKLQERWRDTHYFAVVDVVNKVAVQNWANQIAQSCGEINLLINNASIINRSAQVWDIPVDEFQQVMDVNVMGTVHCIHYMKPHLSEEGKIINISSGWGREGAEHQSAYCASKFAIEGLTQSLARELGGSKQIAVTLDPRDGVATPMLEICAPDYVSEAPSPEDWAEVSVPYMISIGMADNGKALTCPEVPKKKLMDSPHLLFSLDAKANSMSTEESHLSEGQRLDITLQ